MAAITDPPTVLSVKGLTKAFGQVKAVDIDRLEVRQGEIFGFLGPNGAGKSTTIRLILDILRPDSGTITILGRPHKKVTRTHQDIGFLSGEMVLDTDLTGAQYLRLVSNLYGGGHAGTIAQLAETLEADLHVRIGQYSRGNRQKIGLIAALLHSPKLLILDEPTSGFDPLVQEKFATLISDYVTKGGTVFMSSHILAEVQHLCHRVAFIRGGRIIATKDVDELLRSNAKRIHVTASTATIAKLGKDYTKLSGLTLLTSTGDTIIFSYAGDIQKLLKFFADKRLSDITIREPELDEIFGQYYESTPESEASRA